jgi:uncharacterized protein (DUF1810 family)
MSDEARPLPPLSPRIANQVAAREDLDDIRTLRRTPAFVRYFLRRLAELDAAPAERLLGPRMERETYLEMLARHHALRDVLGLLDADEAANKSIAHPGQ